MITSFFLRILIVFFTFLEICNLLFPRRSSTSKFEVNCVYVRRLLFDKSSCLMFVGKKHDLLEILLSPKSSLMRESGNLHDIFFISLLLA